MAPALVDVGRLLNGNEAVSCKIFGVGLLHRRNLFEDLESAGEEPGGRFAVAPRVGGERQADETIDDPGGAMAVLGAVPTYAGRIIGDAARIGLGMLVERGLEQQDA